MVYENNYITQTDTIFHLLLQSILFHWMSFPDSMFISLSAFMFKSVSVLKLILSFAYTSILPFEVLFTGLIINQIYFWSMNQTIIQRALGAKNLAEAQKGLLFTGVLKLFVPVIIILPGIIGFY